MLGEDLTPFDQATGQQSVNRILIEQYMEEADVNEADLDPISYMETHAPSSEMHQHGLALQLPNSGHRMQWCPNQLGTGLYTKTRFSSQKRRSFTSVKHFS